MMIPKTIAHIWIGPQAPPIEWMASWKVHHPDWNYILYDNEFMINYPFRNRELIKAYFQGGKYAGVADLMRYEILHDFGGFIPEADSLCLQPVDALFEQGSIFTVYESETARPGNVSPILASAKGHPFLKTIIDDLSLLTPKELRKPYLSTGNSYLKKMIAKYQPDIEILPSRTFIPNHYSEENADQHSGYGKDVYACQFWGTTTKCYQHPTHHSSLKAAKERILKGLLGN